MPIRGNPRTQSDASDICRSDRNLSEQNGNPEITNGRLAESSKYVLSCPRDKQFFFRIDKIVPAVSNGARAKFFPPDVRGRGKHVHISRRDAQRKREGEKKCGAKEEIEAKLTDWKLFGSRRSTNRVEKTIKTIIASYREVKRDRRRRII